MVPHPPKARRLVLSPPVLVFTGLYWSVLVRSSTGRSGLSFPALWLCRRYRKPLRPPGASLWSRPPPVPAGPPGRQAAPPPLRAATSPLSAAPSPACSRTQQPGGTPKRVWGLPPERCSLPSLLKAYDEHQKILKAHAARKRAPENGSEEPEDKRLRPDGPSGLLGPLNFSGGDPNPSYNCWYQHGYGTYGYQSPWGGYGHHYGQS